MLWSPWLLLKSLSRFRVIDTLSLALLNLSSRMCASATLRGGRRQCHHPASRRPEVSKAHAIHCMCTCTTAARGRSSPHAQHRQSYTGHGSPVNSVCHNALIRIDAGCAVRVCERFPGRRGHRRLLQRYLQLLALRINSANSRRTRAAAALYAVDIVDLAQALTAAIYTGCVASDVIAVSPA